MKFCYVALVILLPMVVNPSQINIVLYLCESQMIAKLVKTTNVH